jgi:hypothetical protein
LAFVGQDLVYGHEIPHARCPGKCSRTIGPGAFNIGAEWELAMVFPRLSIVLQDISEVSAGVVRLLRARSQDDRQPRGFPLNSLTLLEISFWHGRQGVSFW